MYSIGTRRKKDTGSYCKLRNHKTGDLLGKKYIKYRLCTESTKQLTALYSTGTVFLQLGIYKIFFRSPFGVRKKCSRVCWPPYINIKQCFKSIVYGPKFDAINAFL